ncbi:unnamed protein product [Haemonchus placei]|uniref:Cytoplasmic dynein 2 heavy chain 1 n=1 Tax=Haemonchus placei TaxID=6290 RepID=A0A158QRJ2_HAEPC|nr:unnamed protein product [Haemonchus placei]
MTCSEIRLECIVVSTAGAKSAIDELLQRLFDTLTWTLRLSINTKLQAIQQFLTQAINVLSSRPQSVDEVAEANARHTEYNRTNKELKASWAVLNEQHTLLRSVAGSGVDQMSSLTDQWEKFELMLDSHQMMIKEQVEVLKSNVDVRVKALNDESEKLLARWNQFKPKSDALQGDRQAMLKAIEFIKEKRLEYDELTAKREKLEYVGLRLPNGAINNWVIYEEFNAELQTLADEEWIVFRSKTYLFDELLQKWMEKLKSAQQTHMSVRLLKEIDTFREFSGCLKFCRGEMLSTDHWLEMFRLLQLPRGTTLEKLRFGDLISVAPNVIQNVEQLKALNAKAQGEVTIREAIQELEMWAAQAEFSFSDYKHSNGSNMKVIRDWKESINSVKDSQALLQSLKNSPFYAQFSDKTNVWETRLSDLDVYLPQMNDIQRKWIYLEPIFGRGALPAEASRFARVDSEFRLILADVVRDARLVSLCSRHSLRKSLEQIIDQLNRCQKALNQFLEEKRSAFPRFYFLGDDDLLEILGQSTNPTVIQSHLKKLFQGIDKVVFGANNETISAMLSVQGEHVPLSRPVRVVPQVEVWLQNLSDEMRTTLKKLSVEAIREENVDPARYPSQVLCLAEQVRFCRDCEQALDGSRDFAKLKAALQEQLKTYTNTKVSDVVLDLKLKALILDLIHHIDVVDQLISNKASSSQCWTWQRQLRFYLVGDGVVARQVNSEFNYTYEYQGNTPKLVHTPLTDKCYLTLTQAMYMGLGGNPYGPAGTGKTESVKALASLFGRQVLVFNCDEGIDVHSMSRIFVGIVQCGAWGCFDEFNRLDQTVLSAVSMQIQTIQDVIKSKSGTCVLGGKTASVDPNAAIFITLNPAGKGYGGRQKMPDNLKQLFRPVVMSVPDNDVIAETILYSEGFTDAKNLARKIVTIFKLSKEMLSAQQHYDWGLRALKVVLRGCGDIRAAKPEANETETVVQVVLRGCGDIRAAKPEANETETVVQALLLNTLSKLTFADSKRFSVLIDDVFSTVNKEMTTVRKSLQKQHLTSPCSFGDLVEPLKQASEEMNIELTSKQLQKVFQLHEQLRQRIGVVVVGPTGAGKSTIWRVLRRAQLLAGVALHTVSFNPKAMNRTKLLGHMDIDTREWSDGILTMAAREVIKDTSVHQWIIFDGDIDPEWVEALNSNADKITKVFSEEDVSAKEVVSQWIKSLSESEHPDLPDWIDQHFYRCYDWCVSAGLVNGIGKVAAIHNGLSHLRYQDDLGMGVKLDELKADTKPFILTAPAQSNKDTVLSWLKGSNRQPFVVVGPDGCGKEELLKHCFGEDNDSQLAIVHSSAQSGASAILQCLQQHCVQTSSATGRVLRPKDKPLLILYLKNINLPAPDKYGTNEMLAFLHQLLTYHGYYDDHLDWIGLENVQFFDECKREGPGRDRTGDLLRVKQT